MGSGSQLYDQSESKLQLLDKIKMFEYALEHGPRGYEGKRGCHVLPKATRQTSMVEQSEVCYLSFLGHDTG